MVDIDCAAAEKNGNKFGRGTTSTTGGAFDRLPSPSDVPTGTTLEGESGIIQGTPINVEFFNEA
jgi:hypothetical protein